MYHLVECSRRHVGKWQAFVSGVEPVVYIYIITPRITINM